MSDNKKGDEQADPFPQGSTFSINGKDVKAKNRNEEKIMRRLAKFRPDIASLVEPGTINFGYIPRRMGAGSSCTERLPSGNTYYMTALSPATLTSCEDKTKWAQDIAWFEKGVTKGNFIKVPVTYDEKGKIQVGKILKKILIRSPKVHDDRKGSPPKTDLDKAMKEAGIEDTPEDKDKPKRTYARKGGK